MSEMIANRYLIAKDLGHGGMADVYLAMDTVLNREVAIKLLRGELCADPVSLLRFQREANAASALTHPNIVEIYDVGEYNGRQYIVMEYVRGKTLKQLIANRGALDNQESVTIMKQLVDAVREAHAHGIIHRDIKPQNVLIKDDGTIKITDFGIALAEDAVQLTQTDSVMGSVHYLAPEVARGETASEQSDIYSLGIVLYELLCGDVPFHGDSPIQIAMKHMEEDVPSVRELNPNVPQSLENIITKATAKNKAYRYRSAEEMLEDISTCLDDSRKNEEKLVLGDNPFGSTITIQKLDNKTTKDTKKEKEPFNLLNTTLGILLIILAVAATLGIMVISRQNADKTIPMIDITGMTMEQATFELENVGLSMGKATYMMTDDIPEGIIISSSPAKEESVEKGTAVNVSVSRGEYFVIGDYSGKQESEVRSLLSQHSNVRITVEREYNSSYEAGTVIRQELLLPGDKIDTTIRYELKLIVASYLEFLIPSDLVGKNIYEAKNLLEGMGATVLLNPMDRSTLTEEELKTIVFDTVIRYAPDSGYYVQREGNYITLYYY
ncbi:MAG: Stk1 family PASTA domain-containing Ser/Thr kinase [Erysipelotrichaceae bacterium]|nr:Stk1 family PASTA domain-containing Ser/Thr kinase [Erysipelotrichaceae bacterium]